MSEKLLRRSGVMKTPRITRQGTGVSQQSGTIHASSQRGILPLISGNSDPVPIDVAKQTFHKFIDSLATFLTHNGSTVSFRAQISQQATELDHLFNSFSHSSLKTSIPALQNLQRPSSANRQPTMAFAKGWQCIVRSLLQIKKNGSVTLRQSLENHFGVISGALDTVMRNGVKANVHDISFRNCRCLQGQLVTLNKTVMMFVERPVRNDILKKLDGDLKTFSRNLNDAFSREFSQCGIAQNEVVRLRTRSYSACCDIIHQLKACYMFDGDMSRLMESVHEFQEHLKGVYSRFSIPSTFLVNLEEPSSAEEEVGEEEETKTCEEEQKEPESKKYSFNNALSLVEFIQDCEQNRDLIAANEDDYLQFYQIVKGKAIALRTNLAEEQALRRDAEARTAEMCQNSARGADMNKQLMIENQKWKAEVHMQDQRIIKLRQCLFDLVGMIGEDLGVSCDASDDELCNCAVASLREELSKSCEQCKLRDKSEVSFQHQIKELKTQVRTLQDEISEYEQNDALMKELVGEGDAMFKIRALKGVEQELTDIFGCPAGSIRSKAKILVEQEKRITEKLQLLGESGTLDEITDRLISEINQTKEAVKSAIGSVGNDDLLSVTNAAISMILDTKHALAQIVPNQNNVTEQAKACVSVYNELCIQNKEYKATLENVGKVIGTGENVADSVKKLITSSHNFTSKVCRGLGKLTGAKVELTEQFALSEITALGKQMKSDNEALVSLQKLSSETENRLSKLCGTVTSKKPIHESIPLLLTALEQQAVNASSMKKIEVKLFQMLNTDRITEKDPTKRIFELLESAQSTITGNRKALEEIAMKVLKNTDIFALETKLLVTKVSKAIDAMSGPSNIDEMFSEVFTLVPVTSKTNYREYVPEFCSAFATLHNSVMSLKPFASTLNNIFTQFDCKYTSFCPGSQSYQFLRSQIFALHGALNNIVPSKINSLVFLVLSRFIALFSSFMTAITAASFDSGDVKMKEEFFNLEQENQKYVAQKQNT